jgi:hypothetical protein
MTRGEEFELRSLLFAFGYRSVAGRRSDASSMNQLPDPSTTWRCARVAPQDVDYAGRRKDPGLRYLVTSDGGDRLRRSSNARAPCAADPGMCLT